MAQKKWTLSTSLWQAFILKVARASEQCLSESQQGGPERARDAALSHWEALPFHSEGDFLGTSTYV